MTDFRIDIQKIQNDFTLLKLNGFLDAYTYSEFERIISDLFEKRQFRIIVDISNLNYISSAGAGVFIGAFAVAQENHGTIIVVKPQSSVKEVFDLLGLSQIFPIYDTVDDAMHSLT